MRQSKNRQDTCRREGAQIDHLSKSNKDYNKRTLTPLTRACSAGHGGVIDKRRLDVIKYLLEKGADPTYKTMSRTPWNEGVPYRTTLHLLVESVIKCDFDTESAANISQAIECILKSCHLLDQKKRKAFLDARDLSEECHATAPELAQKWKSKLTGKRAEACDLLIDRLCGRSDLTEVTGCNALKDIESKVGQNSKKLDKSPIEKTADLFVFWVPFAVSQEIILTLLSFDFISNALSNKHIDFSDRKVVFCVSLLVAMATYAFVLYDFHYSKEEKSTSEKFTSSRITNIVATNTSRKEMLTH